MRSLLQIKAEIQAEKDMIKIETFKNDIISGKIKEEDIEKEYKKLKE